jgi:hypothetical protein
MKFRKLKSPATKTIEFKLHADLDERVYALPTPTKDHIPEWFKVMPSTVDNSPLSIQPSNLTIKDNLIFSDPFSLGYTAVTPYEIEFMDQRESLPKEMQEDPNISVSDAPRLDFAYPGYPIVHQSDFEQHAHLKEPEGHYHEMAYSWNFWFTIKTPKGYSVLITSPLNQNNLFWTNTSIVIDTDKDVVLPPLPFFLSKLSPKHIVPKGTPVMQIIPFKRDSWVRDVAPITENNLQTHRSSKKTSMEEQLQVPYVWYKTTRWNKKEFN